MKNLALIMLCMMLVLSGCAARTNPDGSTNSDSAQTVGEGAGAGAIFGALLGGVAAIATGNARWIAVGAGAGALVGTGVGLYVAKKKEDYATREAWLDDSIAKAQAANTNTAAYNDKLKAELTKLDAQSQQLAAAYKMQAAKASDMKKMQATLANQQQTTNNYIADMEKVIVAQKAVVADARSEKREREAAIIEHEIAKMQLQVDELREESNKLANMSMRVSI